MNPFFHLVNDDAGTLQHILTSADRPLRLPGGVLPFCDQSA